MASTFSLLLVSILTLLHRPPLAASNLHNTTTMFRSQIHPQKPQEMASTFSHPPPPTAARRIKPPQYHHHVPITDSRSENDLEGAAVGSLHCRDYDEDVMKMKACSR
ncbi:hypothetical protein OROGR_011442 [Orobanche gracilis]